MDTFEEYAILSKHEDNCRKFTNDTLYVNLMILIRRIRSTPNKIFIYSLILTKIFELPSIYLVNQLNLLMRASLLSLH